MSHRNRTIPRSDPKVVRFVRAFANAVAKNPEAYGFSSLDAEEMLAAAAQLSSAYAVAIRPGTRTAGTVRTKNEIRKNVVDQFRGYIRQVNANPNITDEQREDLGIAIADPRKSPHPAPRKPPKLYITSALPQQHTLGYWNVADGMSTAKPEGVTHLILLGSVADKPSGTPATCRFIGAYTRTPIRVNHDAADIGRTATYYACWLTGSGEQSQFSDPISMIITGAAPGSAAQASATEEKPLALAA